MLRFVLTSVLAIFMLTACTKTVEEVQNTWEDGSPKEVFIYEVKEGQKYKVGYRNHHANGQVYVEGYFKNNRRTGTWTAYFENGMKQSENQYKKGYNHGASKVWFPNGKIRYQGSYTNNVKTGEWQYYKEDGSIATTVDY